MTRSRTAMESIQDVRVPPHNIDAEMSTLGSLLIDPKALDSIRDIVGFLDFYRRDHQLIYRAICELADASSPYDAVTISDWFERMELSDQVGGISYMTSLAQTQPSSANVKAYATIVAEHATLRRLLQASMDIQGGVWNPGLATVPEIVAAAERAIFTVAESAGRLQDNLKPIKEVARGFFETLAERYENPGATSGLSTGFVDLDTLFGGLRGGDVIVLAGRPAMGKTTLAVNIAEHVSIEKAKIVLLVSLEMTADQLVERMVASQGRIDATRLRTGELEDEHWARVNLGMTKLTRANIMIDDQSMGTPEGIRTRSRRMKREGGLDLIVVDYIQLMSTPGNSENRATEVGEISRSMKNLAKELNVPIILLSQLNRGLESRADKRPVMSDLRESGAIEQDADIVAFVYRDEYYHRDSAEKGIAEIIVSKHRNGPTGMAKLIFNGSHNRFDNLARGSSSC